MFIPIAIMVGLALLPLLLYGILKEPYILAILVLLFIYFRLHELSATSAQWTIIQVLVILTMGAFLLHLFFGHIKIYWTDELKLFLAFFIWVSLGVVFAHDRQIAYHVWEGEFVKIGIVTLIIAWTIKRPELFGISIKLFIAAGVLLSCIALYNFTHGLEFHSGTRVTIGRSWGSKLEDPNDLALTLMFPMGFMIASLLTRRSDFINRLLSLSGLCVIFPAILATGSRGGLLGMLAVLAAYIFYKIKWRWVFLTLVAGAAMVKLALVIIGSGFSIEGLEASVAGRVYAWRAGFNMAMHHPFFGVGLANFTDLHSMYGLRNSSLTAHSIWFQVMGDCGFVGFIIFVLMISVTLINCYNILHKLRVKAKQEPDDKSIRLLYISSQGIFYGLVGFCASGTFLSQAFDWPLYIYICLFAGIQHIIATQYQDIGTVKLPAFMEKLLRRKSKPVSANDIM